MALINCPECGKEISDKAYTCPNCGNPMGVPSRIENMQYDNEEEYIFCPKCLSMQVHSEHKGFSGGSALAGAIAFGGIGLLAGTIGSKEVNVTCLKCGYKFKAGDSLVATMNEKREIEKELNNEIKNGGEDAAIKYIRKRMNWRYAKTYDFVQAYMKGHPDIKMIHTDNETQKSGEGISNIGCMALCVLIGIILLALFSLFS